jgi:hypothetical protein
MLTPMIASTDIVNQRVGKEWLLSDIRPLFLFAIAQRAKLSVEQKISVV